MRQHFMMFAAYNRWANARLYEAAVVLSEDELNRNTGAYFKSLLGTLNHILVADRIWLKRFTGQGDAPSSLDTTLSADIAHLHALRRAEDERIVAWISGLSEKAMSGRFTYTTVTDMRTISQRLAPALAHFFNHQTHHRGQAHAMLSGTAVEPPQLDEFLMPSDAPFRVADMAALGWDETAVYGP